MIENLFALLLFLFPLAYSPGPGNMFFAAYGARFGFKATLPANFGYHIATWVVTASIGFGFATAVGTYPNLFTPLKIIGSIYVFWLAWKIMSASPIQGSEEARTARIYDGMLLLILNPKAYIIITLMFTQFLSKSNMGHTFEVIFITTIFTLNNLIAFTLWTLIGDRIASQFRTPKTAKYLNVGFGGMLAVVALWMLVS